GARRAGAPGAAALLDQADAVRIRAREPEADGADGAADGPAGTGADDVARPRARPGGGARPDDGRPPRRRLGRGRRGARLRRREDGPRGVPRRLRSPRQPRDGAGVAALVRGRSDAAGAGRGVDPREAITAEPPAWDRIAAEARMIPALQTMLKEELDTLRLYLGLRETGKHYFMKG